MQHQVGKIRNCVFGVTKARSVLGFRKGFRGFGVIMSRDCSARPIPEVPRTAGFSSCPPGRCV